MGIYGALKWSILVGKQKHNVQRPIGAYPSRLRDLWRIITRFRVHVCSTVTRLGRDYHITVHFIHKIGGNFFNGTVFECEEIPYLTRADWKSGIVVIGAVRTATQRYLGASYKHRNEAIESKTKMADNSNSQMLNSQNEKKIFDPTEYQHTRYNPLRGDWILVSPHRMKRPWKGQVEKPQEDEIPRWDAKNPLCPRTVRASGKASLRINTI